MLLRETVLWPARLIDAWVGAVSDAAYLDIAVLSAVTVGAALFSWVVDDEIGRRIAGEVPEVASGPKSFFISAPALILFFTAGFALFLPVNPLTRLVAFLAWPATFLWTLMLMPIYLVTGERLVTTFDGLDTGDYVIASIILGVIGLWLYNYSPIAGAILIALALTGLPAFCKEEDSLL